MAKQYIEIVIALLVALAFGLGLLEAIDYPGKSGYVPVAVLIFSIILSIIWLGQSITSLRRTPEVLSVKRAEALRFAIFVSIAILYALGFYLVGFYTSTLLMIPITAGLLGFRRWKVTIGTAFVYLIILNVVFNLLLKTPLPPELIFRLKDML